MSASHRRAADSTSVSSTVCRSKVERLMTLSTSAVAVCCCSDSRSSLSSRVFSMAMTACVGEVLDQLDLLVGEGTDLLPVDADYADQFVVLEHRHGEEGAGTPEVSERSDCRIAIEVGLGRSQIIDMHYLPCSRDTAETAAGIGTDYHAAGECPRRRVGRYAARQRGTPRRHRD